MNEPVISHCKVAGKWRRSLPLLGFLILVLGAFGAATWVSGQQSEAMHLVASGCVGCGDKATMRNFADLNDGTAERSPTAQHLVLPRTIEVAP